MALASIGASGIDNLLRGNHMKKLIIATILVLATAQAFAEETDSRCGQIDDGPERTTREIEGEEGQGARDAEATGA